MKNFFTFSFLKVCLFFLVLSSQVIAQDTPDSLKLVYPFRDYKELPAKRNTGISFPNPSNVKRSVEFDPILKRYVIREKIGDRFYREPQYMTIEEYQRYESQLTKQNYWRELSNLSVAEAREPGFIPKIKINSKGFDRIFGGSTIDIRPQGSAELTFSGRINRNENPLLNERQRVQANFDFNQRIQMNLVGQIGDKLRISTNYNTEAQFDFENQVKLDYTGKEDEIIKKIEAGNVSLPLSSSLITGSQALFGLKTQLQFGRLNVTSIFTQQKSKQREITITNGSQQNEFRLSADNYEANKHFFLAQYFRNNYNKALANIPIVTSSVNITKIEVWVTNRSNSTVDSRDVLGLLDLGENNPYNNTQNPTNPGQITGGTSVLPAAFNDDVSFPQRSNNLLDILPANSRSTNSNEVNAFFQGNGGSDNFAKLTYARRLTDREFILNAQLGYISLNTSLNADEVLAVAYRYTANGVEYQVGEFSTDRPVDNTNPEVLFIKLLKNETLRTYLPTWDLMMKNIYSLGAYQVSRTDFRLNIFRLDEATGVEKPQMSEGEAIKNKLWLQVTNLDNLNQQSDRKPDGVFDFIEGVTIDAVNGRITFPLTEPFGSDLAAKFDPGTEQSLIDKYVYQALYDSTKVIAQQLFQRQNRYIIKGTYQSQSGSEFQLNTVNIPQGSVQVTAGTLPLQEGVDFTVDYNIGRVKILNQALLSSGQPIRIKLENNELFGLQQRSLTGTRFDYRANKKLNLGGTIMNLTEKPLTKKVNIGEESISNTIWGVDANYTSNSRWLTRMVDKIPFINTKETSTISFAGEFANIIPGHPKALNFAGSKNGASYLDDFEGSRSLIDIKSANIWQISGTPQLFNEAQLTNDLAYGYNRARLAFYNIDPIFFNTGNTLTPDNIRNNKNEQSNTYVRQIFEKEVFPFKDSPTGTPLLLPTLDLAFYPTIRGPYNFSTSSLNADGTFANPKEKWGGIFRRLETNDFESLNVEFIELWVLDPFLKKPNSSGGDVYFNLGNISEDILKDGRKSLENGLPADGDATKTDETIWGKVPKLQPVIQAFDNNPDARRFQDIGLDGLNNDEERQKFSDFLTQLNPQTAGQLQADPASDDYQYFRGSNLDQVNAGILKRYEKYNGTDGNSKTTQQSLDLTGIDNSAATPSPDGEDINRDNNSNQADEYFQYKISMKPADLSLGNPNNPYLADIVEPTVKLANGNQETVRWLQFKIPIAEGEKVGNIQDFKSIRFVRMFMTGFEDTTILRLAKLQLVRGEWRRYNAENNPVKVIADPSLINPGLDQSVLDVGTINIEENGRRTPIPYVVPPGIDRERDYSNFSGESQQNEQSLAVNVKNLGDGYSRAAYRTTLNDFRSYRRLELFVHAEAYGTSPLKDNDVNAFIRVGADNQDNYYECSIPLKVTSPGTQDPSSIWPDQNKINIELKVFQNAKIARNSAKLPNGQPWPINVPYTFKDGVNTITILGQPDLSKVRVYMLGVSNPLNDGLENSAQVWFNELRLTDFDEGGGWAANARLSAKLADFADVSVSGAKSTVGFGSIDKRVSERNRTDNVLFDISSNMELGKFFPARIGIKVPVFINFSSQVSTPQYDPRTQDIELKNVLKNAPKSVSDSILFDIEDYTTRKSINLINVRKIKTNTSAKNHLWDIENLSLSYSYNEFNHRDFINEKTLNKNYRAGLAYTYSNQAKFITPFGKIIKSKNLALLRDFNFSLMPSALNFRVDVDRLYSENTLRNNDPNNFLPINTNFNKNFQMTRFYGVSWNLTKAVQIEFNANNFSVIDEPEGRITALARDTIIENLKKLGRTTDYGHTVNVTYAVPINKLPGLDWVTLAARYGGSFNWKTEPLITLRDPNIDFGNTIQNSRNLQLNPTLSFTSLYNKFGFIRKINSKKENSIGKTLITALTGLKNISGSYNRTDGTFLPGYLPKTDLLGQSFDANAPGYDFLFGSQQDIRGRALANGWITRDSLLSQLYVTTRKDDLNLRGLIEPFKDLRIELTATRSQSFNYSTNFRFSPETGGFQNFSPVTSGDFSISYFSLFTSFSKVNKDNSSNLFKQFESNRAIISQRLGAQNPNSAGTANNFADGYGKTSQDVLVTSFLAAYSGKNANNISLNRFPKIPIPNWRITYNGLAKYAFFEALFSSIDLNHSYRSTYNVNGFSSLIRYQEQNGGVNVKDVNDNFLPYYQFSQITLTEQFVPLLGVDVRLKNNMTTNFEYRKSRTLGFSLSNSQLAEQKESAIVFGLGYRTSKFRFPFGILKGLKLDNDMNFKFDFALNDRKTLIYRADVEDAEVSSGAKNITFRPSVDYVLNQRFNVRLFYDGNITRPYTSQTFNTSFSNFGLSLRFALQ